MQEVSYIQKAEKKAGMNYRAVMHDDVTALVRPQFVKHGIVYHPVEPFEFKVDGNRVELKLTLRFVNVDNPQEFFDVPSMGFGIDNSDKGSGKAISYAVKYALLKCLGLESGDDPDKESIEHIPTVSDTRSVEEVLGSRFPKPEALPSKPAWKKP